jgi:hypothetical protein
VAIWLLSLFVRFSEAKHSVQHRESGQGLVEYSMVLLFVAIVIVAIVGAIGRTLCTSWYLAMFDGPIKPFGELDPSTCSS